MNEGYGRVCVWFIPHGNVKHKNLVVKDVTFRLENGNYIMTSKTGNTVMIPESAVLFIIFEREEYRYMDEEKCITLYLGDEAVEEDGNSEEDE